MRAAGDAVAATARSGGFARAAGGVWHRRHGAVCVCFRCVQSVRQGAVVVAVAAAGARSFGLRLLVGGEMASLLFEAMRKERVRAG